MKEEEAWEGGRHCNTKNREQDVGGFVLARWRRRKVSGGGGGDEGEGRGGRWMHRNRTENKTWMALCFLDGGGRRAGELLGKDRQGGRKRIKQGG